MTTARNTRGEVPGCVLGAAIRDYGSVSETQDKPVAGNDQSAPEPHSNNAPDASEAPYKPVIAAKAAKRANASVIGMVIAWSSVSSHSFLWS